VAFPLLAVEIQRLRFARLDSQILHLVTSQQAAGLPLNISKEKNFLA
jgi:hypothetical protein